MINRIVSVILFAPALCLAQSVSDQQIRDEIVLAGCYIDNPRASADELREAFALCGDDSNRLSRILYEIALTNNKFFASSAVRFLGYHGTPAQLPYLYSVVTNEIRGAEAAKAILRIEGVTTNSILAVSNCIKRIEIDDYERYKAFRDFVEKVYCLAADNPNRNIGIGLINDHVRNENMYCKGIDKLLIKVDPSYRTSKRRLADLRSAINRGVHEFQLNYITNAINELVAYPEADLPE